MSKRTFEEATNAVEMSENRTENNMTMDSLPNNVIHLGGNQFLVVRSFQGQTRVHIRKFIQDDDKKLIPTKDGVSLTPRVWTSFTEKLPKLLSKRYFDRYPNDYVEVVERDLCVFKNTVTDGSAEKIEVVLQRMFQRRNQTYQLVSETVHLDDQQCYVLLSASNHVKELIEISLLTVTLRYHVEKTVMRQTSPEARSYNARPYNTGLGVSLKSLSKSFLNCLSIEIKKMAPCYGCDELPCTCHTAEELLNSYFETALYALNFDELAQIFVAENIHHVYFVNLILSKDFFTQINVPSFLNDVKNMYAPAEELSCEMIEYC